MKQKICVTIPSMHGAGCERMLADVLPHYAAEFDTDLVLLDRNIKYEIPNDINITYLDTSLSDGGLMTKMWAALSTIIRLRRHLDRNKYSAIVSYLDGYNALVYIANAFRRNKSLHIACEHTLDREFFRYSSMAAWKKKVTTFVIKHTYNRVNHIIAVSHNVEDFLKDELGIKTPITVIHNGIDTTKFDLTPPNDISILDDRFIEAPVRFLSISRLDYQKNIPFLLDSFAAARDRIGDAKLFILGTGPEERTVAEKIDLLNLQNSVYLLGFRENPQDYLKLCNVFLLTSRYESLGNVVIEAIACGIPVVTTNYGEVIREIITSDDLGTIIEQDNIQGFADAIVAALHHKKYDRERLSNYAHSRFDVTIKAKEYVDTVKSVLSN